jgi:hypothetical protein
MPLSTFPFCDRLEPITSMQRCVQAAQLVFFFFKKRVSGTQKHAMIKIEQHGPNHFRLSSH